MTQFLNFRLHLMTVLETARLSDSMTLKTLTMLIVTINF